MAGTTLPLCCTSHDIPEDVDRKQDVTNSDSGCHGSTYWHSEYAIFTRHVGGVVSVTSNQDQPSGGTRTYSDEQFLEWIPEERGQFIATYSIKLHVGFTSNIDEWPHLPTRRESTV